jgi:hypothetical protein
MIRRYLNSTVIIDINLYRYRKYYILLERYVLTSPGCADSGVAVADGFVGGGVFADVVADVFDADFEGEEFFAVVDAEGEADHFGEDDHVAVVGFDHGFGFGEAGFAEAFEEFLLAGWEAAFEAAALAGGE